MSRPTWKGNLKIGLVVANIKVFPATESSARISFNQLHSECNSRVKQKKWCETCAKEVPNNEIIKGYEHSKGLYVTVSDDEIDAIEVEATRNINIEKFVDHAELDPIYIDRTYFIGPDGPAQTESYALMRDAMRGQVGIGKVALYGREYPVAIVASGKGMRMHTLLHGAEIRDIEKTVPELERVPESVANHPHMELAKSLVESMRGELDMTDFKDEYNEAVVKLVQSKIAGEMIEKKPTADAPQASSLMEALNASLVAVQQTKKKPAKAKAHGAASNVLEHKPSTKRTRRIA